MEIHPHTKLVSLASSNKTATIPGYVLVEFEINGNLYENSKLFVMENLYADVIIGHDILGPHDTISLKFGGKRTNLQLPCTLSIKNLQTISLFKFLDKHARPVATKSRRHSSIGFAIIKDESIAMARSSVCGAKFKRQEQNGN